MTIQLDNPDDGRARDHFGRIWVTTARGAAETGVTEAAIRDWTRRRLLDGHLVNGRRWYRLDKLHELEAAAYRRAQARATQVDGAGSVQPQSDHHHGPVLTNAAQKPVTCVIQAKDDDRDGPCGQPAAIHGHWNVCYSHLAEIFYAYRGTAPDEEGRPEYERPPRQPAPRVGEMVYYIRFADRVKIGFTGNLDSRLANLPLDEVLALEPGGRELETLRHKQFAAARIYVNREWFVLTEDLRSHCSMLVKHYGPPTAHLRAAA